MPRQYRCRSCGRQHTGDGNLHCSKGCANDYAQASEQAVKALTAEGFSRDTSTPNLFWRDGAAVSLEQVIHEGIKQAVAAHSRAVSARS
jgi:hypothetical protein